MTVRFYMATYTNGTTTVQYEVGGTDRSAAVLMADELTPEGYTRSGLLVELPDW